jgi:hypothetical protein
MSHDLLNAIADGRARLRGIFDMLRSYARSAGHLGMHSMADDLDRCADVAEQVGADIWNAHGDELRAQDLAARSEVGGILKALVDQFPQLPIK